MARRKKGGNLMTLLIVAVVAVFSAQYLGLFSIIPLGGLETEGTVDPLYVYSRNINGFGSALGSAYKVEGVAGQSTLAQTYKSGIGITQDYGQIKWFPYMEQITATTARVGIVGIDMTLYGDATGSKFLDCWVYPDAYGTRYGEDEQSAFPGYNAGYYFDKSVELGENKNDHTLNVYYFNTDNPREYDQDKVASLNLQNVEDFNWKKIKQLTSADMEGPGVYTTPISWGPTAGVKEGVIPEPQNILDNWDSYTALTGNTVQCGGVYAFKKEFTIKTDPNNPTDTYVVVALDDNFDLTEKNKQGYLTAPITYAGFKVDLATKPESDIGDRTTDLSKMFYAHFGPCGDNIPLRYQLIGTSRGGSNTNCEYYGRIGDMLSEKAYIYNGELYKDATACAGPTCSANPNWSHVPTKMKCPSDISTAAARDVRYQGASVGTTYKGGGNCNTVTMDEVLTVYNQKYFYTVTPGGVGAYFAGEKEFFGKSDPDYNEVKEFSYTTYRFNTAGGLSLTTIKYDVDFSTVPYIEDLQEVKNVVAPVSDYTPEELSVFAGDGRVSNIDCVTLPKYETSKTFEAPIEKITESDRYGGVFASEENKTYIYLKTGTNHPYIFFYAETPEYKEFREMYKGTQCEVEMTEEEYAATQTVVPNDVIEGDTTIQDVNQDMQTGDQTAQGGIPSGTTPIESEGFDIWIFAIVGLILAGVYFFIIKKKKRR